jgi:hypothetical protein
VGQVAPGHRDAPWGQPGASETEVAARAPFPAGSPFTAGLPPPPPLPHTEESKAQRS